MKKSFVYLLALFSVGFSSVASAQEAPAPETPAAVVPDFVEGDILYGDPAAPIELIEYVSMTCPHCKHFHDEVVKELQKELIPAGKVKVVFRNFVRDRVDVAVAVLSRCTSDVDQAKRLIETYFDRQQEWMRSEQIGIALQSIANTNGISFEDIQACSTNRDFVEHLVEMRRVGVNAFDIKATPTIILNGTKAEFKSFEELLGKIQLAAAGH